MTELVQIRTFTAIGEDARGLTAEFSLPRKQDEFIFITRKAGSLSGNTFHQGKNPATNPKLFILLSGSLNISYRKIGTDTKHTTCVESPSLIQILPNVTHNIEALTDIIILECNSIKDIQNDRVKEEV